MEELQTRPWYRQFWPWFIMALPAASVVGGLLTFYIAGAEPSMVVDDYGRIAMVTEQRAQRAKRARELGLRAQLAFMNDSRQGLAPVIVTLRQRDGTDDWPDRLILKFVHPTLSRLDRTIELSGSRARYTGHVGRPPGRYYVSLSDANGNWRLTGQLAKGSMTLELRADDKGGQGR